MKKITATILVVAAGILFAPSIQAGAWNSITKKTFLPQKPPLKPSTDLVRNTCAAPTPYRWNGQCLACTNPSGAGLERTGYVRCDEGFCHNGGLVALGAIFGAANSSVDVRDCATVPAAPVRTPAATTNYGLGTDEYTIGTVAIPYEGQQLGSLKCDPGSVAVGIKVKSDNIIRSVTELDCKPVNNLSAAGSTPKTPPNPFGGSSGTEASVTAVSGKALYGFNLHYANELEWDNRLSSIIAGQVNPAEVGEINKDEYFQVNHEGDSFALGLLPTGSAPRVPAVCPKKFFVTGIWVLYDSDSVKSVTPTCARVYAPGESPASIPEGTLGLGKWDEVGYLGGRTVSNAAVKGWGLGYSDNLLVAGSDDYPEDAYDLHICPPNMVMTGWSPSSGDIINGLSKIYCEPIASAFGSCANESPERTGTTASLPPDWGGGTYHDYGRMGCAMTGFEYKQQKWRYNEEVMLRAHTGGERERSPGNTQVVSELHSILGNRMQNNILQGHNFGMGRNAGYCNDALLYSCDASDWISVMCPSGSFVTGIKTMFGGRSSDGRYLANLGAYCRKIVPGPWAEGTNPAPGPAVAPVNVSPSLLKPSTPLQFLPPAP